MSDFGFPYVLWESLNNGDSQLVECLEKQQSSHLRKLCEILVPWLQFYKKHNLSYSLGLAIQQSYWWNKPWGNRASYSKHMRHFIKVRRKTKGVIATKVLRRCSLCPALCLGLFRSESYVRTWQTVRKFLREKGEGKEVQRKEQIYNKWCYYQASWKHSEGTRRSIERSTK